MHTQVTTTMVVDNKTSNHITNNSSSNSNLSNRKRCAPKTAWERMEVAHPSRFITHPVVVAISISLVEMITNLCSQHTAKYLHSSADQTLAAIRVRAVLLKLTTIMSRDTEINNKDSVRIQICYLKSKMTTTRVLVEITNMTIIRPRIQTSKNNNNIREITTIKET